VPGTAGIGKTAVFLFARGSPNHIYFTGRNAKAAAEVAVEVGRISPSTKATFLECDLGARATIREGLGNFVSDRLDIFVANAGIMSCPPSLTEDGYEIKWGVNHMGNAAVFRLLLPVMLRTAEQPNSDVRFVSLTSQGYAGHPRPQGIRFDQVRSLSTPLLWTTYGQSKLANIVYAKEVARRFPGITSVAIHPGVVKTDLVNTSQPVTKALVYITHPFGLMTPEEGAYHTVWAATTKDKTLETGEYYEPIGKKMRGSAACRDVELAKRLWEYTEKELEGFVESL
jgi:NAD(P)-dependent dehydrogenase (short-subunit alcohol dehydrogenase family)